MRAKIGIILVGGTGYGAKEFLRLSVNHPEMEVVQIISSTNADCTIESLHQNLNLKNNISTSGEIALSQLENYENKFLVLCLPAEGSASSILALIEEAKKNNVRIIDLSGCCRLRNRDVRLKHYPESATLSNDILESFQYGLSEIYFEKIKDANYISNPGCYATSSILGLAPLQEYSISHVAIDGKSGTSGAGKSLNQNFHHPEMNSSSFAYKVTSHRHQPEILEHLNICSENLVFCPHVIPASRGMLVTSYVFFSEHYDSRKIFDSFESYYADCPFIKLKKEPPKINNVVGGNTCEIFVKPNGHHAVVISTIDNLIKGMSGQAIQNINIMSGIEESIGLPRCGLGLV